jgi:hypothetical protein
MNLSPTYGGVGWGQIEEVSINETHLMDRMRDYPLFNFWHVSNEAFH